MDLTTRREALQVVAASTGILLASNALAVEAVEQPARAAKSSGISFEDIDRQVRSVNLAAYQKEGRHAITTERARTSPADVLADICPIYHGIKGILVGIGDFPLIPSGWRDAVKMFVRAMDAICG